MAIMVHNTLSGEKEEFRTLEKGKVRMYVCGVTVYDHCHMGHARAMVNFDVIRRYLEYRKKDVHYVINFTDVDDRIINRANEEGVGTEVIAERYIGEFFADMDTLGVRRATLYPRASEHIDDMISFIQDLVDKGFAYGVDGDVFFSVEKAKNFGQLKHQALDDLMEGARVEVDERKRSSHDFALWKAAKPGEPRWDSPWGPGRPGWHIECSTMAQKHLGDTLDIHGGGIDLVFPHHEAEIMQSESRTGKKFVKYWLHNGHLNVKGEKMSKSLKNFFTVKDITARFKPQVIRFFLVNAHYKTPLNYSEEALTEAESSYRRLKKARADLRAALKDLDKRKALEERAERSSDLVGEAFDEAMLKKVRKGFRVAMSDDFNTREAIARLFELATAINKVLGDELLLRDVAALEAASELFDEVDDVLGLFYTTDKEVRTCADEGAAAQGDLVAGLVDMLLEMREDARISKDFSRADVIRDGLKALGIEVEDGAGGPTWRTTQE